MAGKTSKKAAKAAAPQGSPKGVSKKAPAKAASAKKASKPAAKATASGPAAPAARAPDAQLAHEKAVERQMEKAEHQHQDPRGPAHQSNPAAQGHGMNPRLDQGAIRNRGVPRMNKIVNWFRRGKGR